MFEYPCPDCGVTKNAHPFDCEYKDHDIEEIRKAYTDILSVLVSYGSVMHTMHSPEGLPFERLRENVNQMLQNQPPKHRGMWRSLHTDCLHELKNSRRVGEDESKGGVYLKTIQERQRDIIPMFEPLQTIYEYGPADGCKDYAVYSMVSWCEFVGLDWEQTKNFVTEWLEETGGWEELSWGERSIDELLRNKRHVHKKGLAWGHLGDEAKSIIDNSNRERAINAGKRYGTVEKTDYDS